MQHAAENQADWVSEAQLGRDRGIERATAHAEDVTPGWNDEAYRLLIDYVTLMRGESFLAEDFVGWASERISAPPPDPRTWGGPIQRAAKRGLIKRLGYAPANTSNRSPKCL